MTRQLWTIGILAPAALAAWPAFAQTAASPRELTPPILVDAERPSASRQTAAEITADEAATPQPAADL